METLEIQAEVFLASFSAGAVVALFFMVLEKVRLEFKVRGVRLVLLDILFWIMAAVFTFFWLRVTVLGRVRGFTFLAFGTGWLFIVALKSFMGDILSDIKDLKKEKRQ